MMKRQSRNRASIVMLAACLLTGNLLYAGEWKNVTSADGMPLSMVQFMKCLDGDVWVGTMDGLVCFTDGEATRVIAGQAAWDVLPAGQRRYWIGTQGGVVLFEDGKTTPSLEGASVGSLERFGDKAIWAVTEQGAAMSLMEHRDGAWKAVPRFKARMVTDLFPVRNGMVWVLLEADGIVAADPDKAPSKWVHHLKGINVRSFCEDDKGRIWCGTWGKGMMVLEEGKWQRHLAKEESAITAIQQDGQGHIWAATNANGLWQHNGAAWTNHLRQEGTINVLERAADGRVYISSQSVPALRVWDGTAWATLLDVPGGFRAVLLGPDRKVWAGNTITGVYIQP